jgi:formylmethanofuran dehydrogenase subunit E
MEEIIESIGDPEMRSQILKVAPFHGYLSTGAFIGIQMLNIAKRVLEASNGDRLFVTCETYNCLPDPFQVLAGCTIGNKGLKIIDHGKMAVTVTKRAPANSRIKGVRIMLDPAKTVQYPRLHAWFMKTEKVSHPEAISILLLAGESVYTWKILNLDVPEKPRKKIAICERCNESFIQKNDEMLCTACLDERMKIDKTDLC